MMLGSMTQNDQADSDAISWFIAMQEEPDNEEVRSAFGQWLEQSEENRQAWGEIEQLQTLAEEHRLKEGIVEAGPQAVEPVVSPLSPQPSAVAPARSATKRFAMAAIAAAVVVLLLTQIPALLLQLKADHITAEGTTREVLLPDGSTVHLGVDSAIAAEFENGRREIVLLQGEAFFYVQRDETKPFVVFHGGTRTRVLGTEFEVRETQNGTEVSVAKGSVEVHSTETTDGGQLLDAGHRVRVEDSNGMVSVSGAVNSGDVAAWRRGELIVDDWTLREVLDTLDRHFDGTILFDGRSTGERRISGAYKLTSPVDAVRLIARAQNLNVRTLADWLVVVTPY